MNRTGRTLSLKGVVNMAIQGNNDSNNGSVEYCEVWIDEREGYAWKVVDFSLGAAEPERVFDMQGGQLWTMPKEQIYNAAFESNFADNRCIAQFQIAVRGGAQTAIGSGYGHLMLDPNHMVTRELGIRAKETSYFSYLVILEEYQINSVESVIQTIKGSAQKVGVALDGDGSV